MATTLLMPKATAVWLVDNTSLSFEQIAAFCGLHPLEVQGVADGDVAGGIMGVNPVQNGQLTREEIEKAEADPNYRMKVSDPKVRVAATKRKGPRYTPISRRNERPNAIRWLLRNHPELKDAQIMRLVGTTKSTIDSVRENTHWNSANIQPMDPVTLGLCTQIELDAIVSATEKATNSIMECAEAVMAHDAADVESYKAFVEERMLVIFEACSFQDITGQRIAKVVETLHFIESRVARFAEALPMQGGEVKMNDEERAAQERKQRLILHGPQLEGEAMAQDEIDRLLG